MLPGVVVGVCVLCSVGGFPSVGNHRVDASTSGHALQPYNGVGVVIVKLSAY